MTAGRTTLNRRTTIAQILLLVLTLGGLVYLGANVVDARPFDDKTTVTVDLAVGGGLYPGSRVTYRGKAIGRITDVRLFNDGVRATAVIDGDVDVPRDTEAVVANLSAIGEQYLDLRPRSSGKPYLADGDTIARSQTRTPLRFDTFLANANDLVTQIDTQDIRTITSELEIALGGDTDLHRFGRRSERALALGERIQPKLSRLQRNAQRPLTTVLSRESELRNIAADLDSLTAEIAESDDTVRSVIAGGPETAALMRRLLVDVDRLIGPVLRDSRILATLADERPEGLKHWLTWVPAQMFGMADSTRGGFGRVLQVPSTTRVCDYGTTRRSPRSTQRHPAVTDARCTDQHPLVQQRGSQNTPRRNR